MTFRKATEKDSEMLLRWRNDIETRTTSLQMEMVKPEEHEAWLEKTLRNPNRLLWIVEEDGQAMGTMRVDTLDGQNGYELSWTVAPEFRGRGLGKRMLMQAVDNYKGVPLKAVIKKNNIASIKMAQAAGFKEVSEKDGIGVWMIDSLRTICGIMSNAVSLPNTITIIRPAKGWLHLNMRELWQYRELAYFFVWRDIKVRYKQTAIGALWAILQPFTAMIVFSVFFGRFVGVPSDGIPYPIFVYAGLLFWNYFSFGLSHSANSMLENGSIIKKIYFPRLIIPIASALTGLVDFFFATLVLAGMMFYFRYLPNPTIVVYVPLLLGITFLSSMGIGCILASVNVKYRDVRYALPFLIQILMFVTPVIYPVSIIKGSYRWLLALNPMSSVIETARGVLFGKPVVASLLSISVGMALFFFLAGIVYFRKTERFFADVI